MLSHQPSHAKHNEASARAARQARQLDGDDGSRAATVTTATATAHDGNDPPHPLDDARHPHANPITRRGRGAFPVPLDPANEASAGATGGPTRGRLRVFAADIRRRFADSLSNLSRRHGRRPAELSEMSAVTPWWAHGLGGWLSIGRLWMWWRLTPVPDAPSGVVERASLERARAEMRARVRRHAIVTPAGGDCDPTPGGDPGTGGRHGA